ncbi:hypothetical protein FA15DRAFT_676157 [Coprinopsis marcescibilis]|uniref:Uncharacterized protein n=1 Tax=Coprinopsis marcescibilis TaxID=230819 RepID=A0A5C3KB51_COPMA|nr:hypothetical protein FA15DRAFT_676157 [Coprinopsis marcescibilis]
MSTHNGIAQFSDARSYAYGNREPLRPGNAPTTLFPKSQQLRVPSAPASPTTPRIPDLSLSANHRQQGRDFSNTSPPQQPTSSVNLNAHRPTQAPKPSSVPTGIPEFQQPAAVLPPDAFLQRFPSFLPDNYPIHFESIFADEFSRTYDTQIPKPSPRHLLCQLTSELTTHLSTLGVPEFEWPTKYSYAFFRVRGQGRHIYTHLGVSTTSGNYLNSINNNNNIHSERSSPYTDVDIAVGPTNDPGSPNLATAVRCHRIKQCWGEQIPPRPKEGWMHGQCAETQSLPAVVTLCEQLGLTDSPVIIQSFAVDRHLEPYKMCGNCLDYVHARIVSRYRKWTVVDMATCVAYNSVRGAYTWQGC